MFQLIYARHLELIYQTREGVFHLITKNPKSINPKSEKQYIKHEKSVSSDIFKTPRSNISNTRRSVSSDIQTPRSNILNTKRSVLSDSQTPRSIYPNRTIWPYHEYKNVEQTCWPNFQGLNYKHIINTITALLN